MLGWCLAVALIAAALWYLRGQLPEIQRVARSLRPRWGLVAAAAGIVLLTYALLIEGWRRVLAALGGALTPWRAAVIWLGSNLARYLPLSGWQLGAMSLMARRESVPVSVSAGASVMLTIVNLLTGLVVFTAASAATPTIAPGGKWLIGAGVVALALAPFALPHVGRIASRLTGRTIVMPRFGPRAIAIAALSTTVAWVLYGLAFWVLAHGILPDTAPGVAGCIAVYTGAYLAGLLAFVPPAGVGAAEYAMLRLSAELGVFAPAEAALLAVVVRIGRTLLEILPGVVALGVAGVADRERGRGRPEEVP
jgi:hypothetical protein